MKLLFNRIFYVAVALLVQLGWILITVWKLAAYSQYFSIGIRVVSILVVLWIVNKNINPSYKLGWTLLIMTVPAFGLVLYLLFGNSRIANAFQKRYETIENESLGYMEQDSGIMERLEEEDFSAAVSYTHLTLPTILLV